MSWLYPFANTARRHRSRSKDRHHRHYSSSSRHSSSAPSIFSLGSSANRSSASSIFSGVSGMSSSSRSHRAKPRSGFISRMIRKIRRLFRELLHYAKRHPAKVFFMVVLPLITGGVLQKLLGTVGIRLPPSLQQAASGSRDFGAGDLGGLGGLAGGGGGVNGLVSLAKMFV